MSTAVDEDTTVLEALDFDPLIPCDSTGHDRGQHGCTPPEPARWKVIIGHGAGGCEPTLHLFCDSRMRFLRADAQNAFHCPEHGSKCINMVCGVCRQPIPNPEALFLLIGEV